MVWLGEHWGTLVVGLVVAAIVVLDIKYIIASRKKGCNSCGMNCSACHGCAGKEWSK